MLKVQGPSRDLCLSVHPIACLTHKQGIAMTCLLLVTPHKYGAAVNNSEDPWRAFVSMMVLRGKWLLLNSHQRVLVLLGDVNIMNHTIKPTPLCLCRMFTVKCTLKKLPASKKNYGYSEGTDGLEKEIYTYRAMCVFCLCVPSCLEHAIACQY